MGVEFDEFKYKSREQENKTTGIGRLFMKISGGLIKDQRQANIATVVVTIVFFAVSIYLLIGNM